MPFWSAAMGKKTTFMRKLSSLAPSLTYSNHTISQPNLMDIVLALSVQKSVHGESYLSTDWQI